MKNNSTTKTFVASAALKNSSSVFKFLAVLLSSTLLFSCDHMDGLDEAVTVVKDQQKARTFTTELHPLNNSGVTGTATFQYVEDGKFEAHVEARNLVPNMVHPQHIHGFGFESKNPENAVCPPMDAAGDDGLLTLGDGLPFYGPVLIPLDNELIPLSAGDFPMANAHGQLNYLEYTKLNTLISAIQKAHNSGISVKNLSLDKRVVVIHGAYVKDGMIVPAGTEGAEYIATLPVACGEIEELF